MKDPNLWFLCPRPNPDARLRLFCVPYAGGGPQLFFKWADALPDVEVHGVNLPGRGRRFAETAYSELMPLASDLSQSMSGLTDKPFVLFGHSMGALICFELARHLRKHHGASPVHLIVSGCYAPHLRDPFPLHHLPDAEFLRQLTRLGGMPEEVLANSELLKLILPVIRADFTLTETYRQVPGEPLSVPITAFSGNRDAMARESAVRAWSQHTTGSFTFELFDGGHFFIHSASDRFMDRLSLCVNNMVYALNGDHRA